MKLAVIVPTYNESRQISDCLAWLRREFEEGILVADGGSTDGTPILAEKVGACVLGCPKGLALQLNAAAQSADAEVLCFIAADSRPEPGWVEVVRRELAPPKLLALGFRLRLDDPGFALRLIEWGGNFRAHYLAATLPDQGLFVRKETFLSLGGLSPESLIPYFTFCDTLRDRGGEVRLLSHGMLSSARKWREGGILRTTARHFQIYRRFRASRLSP